MHGFNFYPLSRAPLSLRPACGGLAAPPFQSGLGLICNPLFNIRRLSLVYKLSLEQYNYCYVDGPLARLVLSILNSIIIYNPLYALYGLKEKSFLNRKKRKKEYFWSKSSLLQKLIERINFPQIKKFSVGAGFAVEGDLLHV